MSDAGFASVTVDSDIGSDLRGLLECDNLRPGDSVSYQLCKQIFISHPLGSKMAESPIRLAQSQPREIKIPDSPEDDIRKEFEKAWKDIQADRNILNTATQSRIYGIASVVMGELGKKGKDAGEPVDLRELWKRDLYFNIVDPLNTAGSMVTSQDPNSPLFQKWGDVYVQGTRYHRSRTMTMMNEEPLYIAWSASAFGYVGRSVYQRALYPLKSFIQTMITDDMVTRKAGLIVARLDQAGSIVDRVMNAMWGVKRSLLKMARTDNVISIGKDEIIETVNLRNVNESMSTSRENIIKNVATAADMPAKLLTQESFVEGFGEGTQDAYAVGQYIDRLRTEIDPAYKWFEIIAQYRAWNPDFYETIQRRYPKEYGDVPHRVAFYRWRNSFEAIWPPIIKEKPSEEVDRDKVKLDAIIQLVDKLEPMLDPGNKARLIQTVYDLLNAMDALFGDAKFELDAMELQDFLGQALEQEREAQEQLKQSKEAIGLEGKERTDSTIASDVVRLLADRNAHGRGLMVR